uniref:Uncharacterized protein n=1 Tax=Coccidioides posadasii RMSCC 3488 TaxID=454284 RepID=A0A0J6FMR8_COCPO|nr:hypothetical protein CPAG_07051 [Coccidioides posadasii RMSCC 3488]
MTNDSGCVLNRDTLGTLHGQQEPAVGQGQIGYFHSPTSLFKAHPPPVKFVRRGRAARYQPIPLNQHRLMMSGTDITPYGSEAMMSTSKLAAQQFCANVVIKTSYFRLSNDVESAGTIFGSGSVKAAQSLRPAIAFGDRNHTAENNPSQNARKVDSRSEDLTFTRVLVSAALDTNRNPRNSGDAWDWRHDIAKIKSRKLDSAVVDLEMEAFWSFRTCASLTEILKGMDG